jgi:hypothetical protein
MFDADLANLVNQAAALARTPSPAALPAGLRAAAPASLPAAAPTAGHLR